MTNVKKFPPHYGYENECKNCGETIRRSRFGNVWYHASGMERCDGKGDGESGSHSLLASPAYEIEPVR